MNPSEQSRLPIVYEDANILVINKPAGIAVHKVNPEDPQETVADILADLYPDMRQVGENPLRPGIVHRLDKDTSGLMVVAKNNEAFFYLKNLFQTRAIKKTYIALVHGSPKESKGTIQAPLGKIGAKQTTRTHGKRDLKERTAVTHYSVTHTYANFSLIEASPETGRTHQIRIHLKSIGHPIAGDSIYGPKNASNPPGLNRLFLHAQRLQFITPDGKSLILETDLPQELQTVLEDLSH
ncbi:MAG: RluA family pseudouridine synthase [Candidatus Yanofskybacteria bacterium]|nr:RluA family pseudouridine synthase [Candidatus Yanofskybacteria bacterium]